ncbi:hypothetical protein, partial [Collinsella sp. AM18-10]|uniref:hypothetical protein n=1 Tax=Collinsella sp. AM18-10 TaxID=2292028 RepID=UPI001F40A513
LRIGRYTNFLDTTFAFVSDIDTSKELETASHLASTFAQGKRSMTFYRLPAAFLAIKIISN